jgi:SulP family sulfate permease
MTSVFDFKPKILASLRGYTKDKFIADLMSGVIVGIVALPLAIVFGIASGVSPEKGIITAIIGGFIVSLLGGCSVQIGGPTGAFVVIVFGIIQQFGLEGLAIATLLAGLMLIGMGLLHMGAIIKFIPYPIIVGFTSGIAVILFSTQIKDLLGLTIANAPVDLISRWTAYVKTIDTINFWATGVAAASILIIVLAPKVFKKIPGSLIAIVVMTVVVYCLDHFAGITTIETIGDRFKINPEMPAPSTIPITFDSIKLLLPSAFTIAMLGAIESLLSATIADGVTGNNHNPNTELIAQGAANIITPLFGGIPVTGAIARTMTNINNGGRSPIAGIVHALVLLLILLFLGSLTMHIPMACLAGVLVVVAYNMSEWRTFRSLLKNPKSDAIVLLVTFFLAVLFDITLAIEVGILLAMVLLVKRLSETSHISILNTRLDMKTDAERTANNDELLLPEGVEVYEIEGPFFFGVANKFEESMRQIAGRRRPRVRIIRMRKVPFMDSTGLHNLDSLYRLSKKNNIQLVLSGVNEDIRHMLIDYGFEEKLGSGNICSHISEAVERARELVTIPVEAQ